MNACIHFYACMNACYPPTFAKGWDIKLILLSVHPSVCPSVTTRHVFVKHGCPRRQQSRNMAKISKSYILTPPHPQGHVMSVKCEQPIDELTVQVWLLYHNPNFKYCTLFVSETGRNYGRTNRQTDGWTDDPNTRCPRRTFQAGGIKTLTWLISSEVLKIEH